jgi:hypothetical protein
VGLCRRHCFSVIPARRGVFAFSSLAVALSGSFLERVVAAVLAVAMQGGAGVEAAYWQAALFAL